MTYVTHQELRRLMTDVTAHQAEDVGSELATVPQDLLTDLVATVRRFLDQTEHATRFPLVEHLADNVLNWYGFTEAWNYPIRPLALSVAIELHQRHRTPDSLTAEDIREADKATGSKLQEMWDAFNTTTPTPTKEA